MTLESNDSEYPTCVLPDSEFLGVLGSTITVTWHNVAGSRLRWAGEDGPGGSCCSIMEVHKSTVVWTLFY